MPYYLCIQSSDKSIQIFFVQIAPLFASQHLQLFPFSLTFSQQFVFVFHGQLPNGHSHQIIVVRNLLLQNRITRLSSLLFLFLLFQTKLVKFDVSKSKQFKYFTFTSSSSSDTFASPHCSSSLRFCSSFQRLTGSGLNLCFWSCSTMADFRLFSMAISFLIFIMMKRAFSFSWSLWACNIPSRYRLRFLYSSLRHSKNSLQICSGESNFLRHPAASKRTFKW